MKSYSTINIYESIGQGHDGTHDPGSAGRHDTNCARQPGMFWLRLTISIAITYSYNWLVTCTCIYEPAHETGTYRNREQRRLR